MQIKRVNWAMWMGLLVSIVGFISYFLVFVWFPTTRDFPWANLLIFAVAITLLLLGLRRAFVKDRPVRSKIVASIVTALGVLIISLFVFTFFIVGRWMPAAHGAPHVGQKAPSFTLNDSDNKSVALSDLLTSPINGKTPKGVLLVFYRGYW